MRTEDGSIIYECLNGKPQAFGVLVDKYREGIYAYAYAELRDFQDAQDVTQEVFLQAYRDLRSLRRRESFAFWLYRIAHRRCVQCCRDRSRRADRDFIEDQDPNAVDGLSLDSYRKSQMDESVREALDSLPDIYREVLVLHYFGGMTIKDMARAMGASPGAIGMRLSRARAQLKEEMIDTMDTAFEGQKLPVGFTFYIVEAVKRIKIHPMPRMAGLPWGLSLAAGIIMTAVSLNPHLSISGDIVIPSGSPLPVESKALKTGEIPVDILDTSQISAIASKQGDGDGGEFLLKSPQNVPMLAPQQDVGGTWTRKANMPTPRVNLSTGVVDRVIYAFGGNKDGGDPGNYVKCVEAYDPATDTWTKKADMSVTNSALSTCAVDGIIYVIGGCSNFRTLSTVEAYNPKTDTWTKKADMPSRRYWLSTCAVDGIIYAIGGTDGTSAFSNVEAYDPATDTWTKKASMPGPKYCPSASVVNGLIYVMGGSVDPVKDFAGISSYDQTMIVYDPNTDTWTDKVDMPVPVNYSSTSVIDGLIYAVGYQERDNTHINSIVTYDPDTDTWTEKSATMPTARSMFATSELNGEIYTIGGGMNWQRALAEGIVEKYDTGSVTVNPKGKMPTKWGEVKQ
jgi:RNA polymerase sigma factor (sigma-70 family)